MAAWGWVLGREGGDGKDGSGEWRDGLEHGGSDSDSSVATVLTAP